MNHPSPIYSGLLLALIISYGLAGCQEEQEPLTDSSPTPSSTLSSTPQAPQETHEDPDKRLLVGHVVAIEGETYTVRSADEETHSIEATSSTLVDEALKEGDKIEIRFSEDHKAIAIRKIRKETMLESGKATESSTEDKTLQGKLSRIDKEQSHYVVITNSDEEKIFMTNANTLIDESAQVGDRVEVKIATDNVDQAIAIRKVRD